MSDDTPIGVAAVEQFYNTVASTCSECGIIRAHMVNLERENADLRRQLAAIVETALYRLLIECRDELADARDDAERLRVRLAALQGARRGVTT